MKFENRGKWFRESIGSDLVDEEELAFAEESDEFNDLFGDELDSIEEGLYVDPANYGNYNDLVDVVDKDGNPQKMTQHTYDANKGSDEFTDAKPKEEPKSVEGDDLKSFADNYGNNEAKKITELQSDIASLVRKERRFGRPGSYRSQVDFLRNRQKDLLKPLAKQLSTSTKYDAAEIVKSIMDKAGVKEKDKNNFGYMLASVPIDDSGKTLANAFNMEAYRFADMVGKFYK